MMEERTSGDINGEKMEEIMLPGFRFHPTDEELVGFYLKRKIQQRPLSIELIKQLDIYKYDPWDLPKLATTGEKEWYFYCPRDRKYRNSARPNRVTGAGFWKATGTDRPIYSSEASSKCIGLKKSLVFYKGRAAKGIKTDWMMHEFRLPSLTDHTVPPKRFLDKTIPANDSWAICRIFKKASSTAQRALSHSWVSPILPENPSSDHILTQYGISTSTDLQHSSITSFSPSDHHDNNNNRNINPIYKPFNQMASTATNNNKTSQNSILNSEECYTFLSPELSHEPYCSTKSIIDASSLLLNMSSSIFGDFGKTSESSLDYITAGMMQEQYYNNGFSITLPQEMQENFGHGEGGINGMIKDPSNNTHFEDQWGSGGTVRSTSGLPFSLPLSVPDAWKSKFLCDSSSDISTGFSTNKCYI